MVAEVVAVVIVVVVLVLVAVVYQHINMFFFTFRVMTPRSNGSRREETRELQIKFSFPSGES